MKLVNCILLASFALTATFANAEGKASCTASPGAKVTTNNEALRLLDQSGSAANTSSTGSTVAR